jgi:hypothetical protein
VNDRVMTMTETMHRKQEGIAMQIMNSKKQTTWK